MKATQTVTFSKRVTIDETSFTSAIIAVEFGTNRKGKPMRSLNQVNTANSVIDDARDGFEAGIISIEEITSIIESQGYSKI